MAYIHKTSNFCLNEFIKRESDLNIIRRDPFLTLNLIRCIQLAQELRERLEQPMTITSCYRTEAYNRSLPGSSSTSQHLTASAFDFKVPDLAKAYEFFQNLTTTLVDELNLGQVILYPTFIHVGLSVAQLEPLRGYQLLVKHSK